MKISLIFCLLFIVGAANGAGFEPLYKDPTTGLSWGRSNPARFYNGCTYFGRFDQNYCNADSYQDGNVLVVVEESEAAIACQRLGARLPTKLEFETLMRNFGHTESNFGLQLTAVGKKQMRSIFNDNPNSTFWTSTIPPKDLTLAYAFNYDYGMIAHERGPTGFPGDFQVEVQARCVK